MVGMGLGLVLRLGATAILARILIPEHFGLLGMVTALTAIAENFKDLGLSTATVQNKDITHPQVSTLFWINVLAGSLLTAIIAALALPIASFYGDNRLIWITVAFSTSFFWGGMTVQHQAILWRKMQFGTLALVNLGSTLLSIIVGVILAWQGFGYWALVWRELSRTMLYAAGVWMICPWRPALPSRKTNIGKLIRMGGDVSAFNLITFFTDNLDFILVGKYFGAVSLGVYRQATQLALLPSNYLTEPVQSVAQPALRVLHDDELRYQQYYRKLLRALSFVVMPLMTLLFLDANPVVLILLGDKWISAVVVFKTFAFAGIIRPLISTAGAVMITCGNSRRYLLLGVLNSIAIILGIVAGLRWDAEGVAVGHVAANYIFFLPAAYIAFKETPIRVGLFVSAILPSAVSTSIMAVGLTVFSSVSAIRNPYLAVAASVPIALVLYLGVWTLMPNGRMKLKEMYSDFALSGFKA